MLILVSTPASKYETLEGQSVVVASLSSEPACARDVDGVSLAKTISTILWNSMRFAHNEEHIPWSRRQSLGGSLEHEARNRSPIALMDHCGIWPNDMQWTLSQILHGACYAKSQYAL